MPGCQRITEHSSVPTANALFATATCARAAAAAEKLTREGLTKEAARERARARAHRADRSRLRELPTIGDRPFGSTEREKRGCPLLARRRRGRRAVDQLGRLPLLLRRRLLEPAFELVHLRGLAARGLPLLEEVRHLRGVTGRKIFSQFQFSGLKLPMLRLVSRAAVACPRAPLGRALSAGSHSDFEPKLRTSGSADAAEIIREQVTQNKVMLYMKGTPASPMCWFSSQVIRILDVTGEAFNSKLFDVWSRRARER